ncbi:hypothetical protein GQ55_7G178000 [Panicum hallii var. hallii]|uniref:Uncharacterized protein n=1 Tax=Panicum hallii var. hallii TaxID=1504633 RepID=A0A2T7CW76_9POAL|nr:hypothetical protein GQ55_7G178000 [Panicum hallii var. hallii]
MQGSRISAGCHEQHAHQVRKEKQRRSRAHNQREKYEKSQLQKRDPVRRCQSSGGERRGRGERRARTRKKAADSGRGSQEQPKKSHSKKSEEQRTTREFSALTFLHTRSPGRAREGASIPPADPRSEQTRRMVRSSELCGGGRLDFWLGELGADGEGGGRRRRREARKRGRNGGC